ncbi:Mercuric resistance operon regulatory protein OS=Afipia felis OX=1035 GN=merR1 PE=4 SV=1 [Afipia felis]|jgi:DNA-binding transcriptional MerR regulator|nr:helix-turn-helix domain-containing protein [Promineifilum sp.]
MKDQLSIGRVAEIVRMNVPTIRYYEEIGLMPAVLRTENNRRIYKQADVRRLNFIRHARELGFDLDSIRQLLTLTGLPDEPCEEADQIARAHLTDVEHKMARLAALRKELRAMIENSTHGRIRECRVIEVLSNFGK